MDEQDFLITDITLDHLPDLSEESLSFQISNVVSVSADDLLLADNTQGFNILRHAVDDDVTFAPVALKHLRGSPFTLAELTPRAQGTPRPPPRNSRSPTPTQPPPSVKPQCRLTHGRDSPDKSIMPPPQRDANSTFRDMDRTHGSEERLDQLRMEVETLSHPNTTPSHDVVQPGNEEPQSPVLIHSRQTSNAPCSPPPSMDRLDPLPEASVTEIPSDKSVVTDLVDNYTIDATNITLPTSRPRLKGNPRMTAKPSTLVQGGGIAKRRTFPVSHVPKNIKSKPTRVLEARQIPPSVLPQLTPPQFVTISTKEELVPPASAGGDIDSTFRNTKMTQPSTTGTTGCLVLDSQISISSNGLCNPSLENSSSEISTGAARVANVHIPTSPPPAAAPPPSLEHINDISSARHGLFRLSEISPQKPPPNVPQPSSPAYTGVLQDAKQVGISLMAKKRIAPDADLPQERHALEKGKMMAADVDCERGSSDEAVSQAHPRPTKKARHEDQLFLRTETRRTTRHLDSSKPTLPSARTKYRPKLNFSPQVKGPTLDPFPYLTSSRQVHETITANKGKCEEGQSQPANLRSQSSQSGFSAGSRHRRNKRTRQQNAVAPSHARQQSGPSSTADLPLTEKKQNATLSVAQLTKPVGFTFRVDARLEARKMEERLGASEPAKTPSHHAVPDIKALRASHQAAFTFHREGTVPTVPAVPFFFCTEQRAKEREKFDGMVRRKEEEMQRLKEEQRRREVEEEEMAIKELRRKLIPKANEIPEWYAAMPKRKGTVV